MTRKEKNKNKHLQNKHLHARVAFLQRAAMHLALQATSVDDRGNYAELPEQTSLPHEITTESSSSTIPGRVPTGGLSFHISSQLRQVARKSQIRLHPSIKRGSCKSCNAVLLPDNTSQESVENRSRGAKKPHANVLVVECSACGATKRFPVGAKRQQRKGRRSTVTLNPDASSAVAVQENNVPSQP